MRTTRWAPSGRVYRPSMAGTDAHNRVSQTTRIPIWSIRARGAEGKHVVVADLPPAVVDRRPRPVQSAGGR